MKIYKITNITNTFSKRELNYNKTILITYVDGMEEKYVEIKPGNSINLNTPKIPLSVHQNRINGTIIVTQIDSRELKTKPKPKKKEEKVLEKNQEVFKLKENKKNLKSKTKSNDESGDDSGSS